MGQLGTQRVGERGPGGCTEFKYSEGMGRAWWGVRWSWGMMGINQGRMKWIHGGSEGVV